MKNLREFLNALASTGQLKVISTEVDPDLELAEIHRRVVQDKNGPALLFEKVKGSPFRLCSNLFGNLDRIRMAFGAEPEECVSNLSEFIKKGHVPKWSHLWAQRRTFLRLLKMGLKPQNRAPVLEHTLPLSPGSGLNLLPAIRQWPEDGGRFVTLPLVYTEHPTTHQHNLGMYRIHIYDEKSTGIHWQIHKGGGFHYHEAEKINQPLPMALFLGGPPALILAAIAPLPENVPELLLASLLLGKKLGQTRVPSFPYPIVSECEFAILGQVPPHVRRPEGPFGDHYGYYSLAHPYPVFQVSQVYHRQDAIFPATVVGKPRQEDFYIGDYLQALLSPLFPLVMPSVVALKTYGETGFHALAAARVKDRYEREAIASALRILGEGQLTLQKFLMLTDGDSVDLEDFKALLIYFLERTDWKKDLIVISNVSQDTLDYTGPKVNEGSKGIWLALGPAKRELSTKMPAQLPRGTRNAKFFVPSCLVIEGPSFEDDKDFAKRLSEDESIGHLELVLVVDNAEETVKSSQDFLWSWFTRFEPAADIYGASYSVNRFHVGLEPPVVFDCRMKPWYPKVVEPDEKTVRLVDKRWKEYGF